VSRCAIGGLRRAWAIAALALALAGCAAAPHPMPASTLVVPTGWRAPSAAGGTTQAVSLQWWEAFGDPTLATLVREALENNADLRMARSRVAEYEARRTIADAARAPLVTANAGPARARSRTPSGAAATTTVHQVGVQASYEVDLWGRLANLSDAALADLQGERAARDAAALSIAATVASGYINLLGLDAQLALARATLHSREESLARAKHLLETGYGSRLDWAQAETEYRSAAGAVPALERSISEQEQALANMLGRESGPLPRGLPLADIAAPVVTPGLPSELLRRRPDIAQAEYQLIASDSSLEAARDALLPSLQLSTNATLQGLTLPRLLGDPMTLWSVGASVLAPMLQRGRLEASAEVAAEQRDQALFAYEQTVRDAFGDVENALSAIDALERQRVEAEARTRSAAEVLRIAHSRYRNGYASYLEELDAQRTSYAAQQNALQIRAALLTSHVDLYRALGGGWGPDLAGRGEAEQPYR
jgi:multidrug efflux system outer membrane protein